MPVVESAPPFSPRLQALLRASSDDLAKQDIAEMNLLCAEGLPGAENLDISACLKTLDDWTAAVKHATAIQLPRFLGRPQRMSEAQLRMWLVIRTLRDRFKLVHKDNQQPSMVERMGRKVERQAESTIDDFRDPGPRFIHGLLGSDRIGTCSSLPVLFAAVALRLGYPAKIATDTGHVFNRWEDEKETFNMEGTGFDYISCNPDEYYVDASGRPWTDYERYHNYLLRGKTAAEELQVFLSIRGACFRAHGRLDEAQACHTAAWRLMPLNEGEASNIRSVLYEQLEEYATTHSEPPPNEHFDARDPKNHLIAIAPRGTQAVLFAARGIWHAFHARPTQSREALQVACRLDPEYAGYPQLAASIETLQCHRLPPSLCVLAGLRNFHEAEALVKERKGMEAVTRYARAQRLHPRNPAPWAAIGRLVQLRCPDGPPARFHPALQCRWYSHAEVAQMLARHAEVFITQHKLSEARWAYEEASHLMPMIPQYRNGIRTSTQLLHHVAQGKSPHTTRKAVT